MLNSPEFNVYRDDVENDYTPPELNETEKEVLEIFDAGVESYLHQAKKANYGNSGLIFKFSLDADVIHKIEDMDSEVIESLIGNPTALKLIKVSSPELARKEFAKQMVVWKLYDEVPKERKKDYAAIPKPILQRVIDIDDETKEHLNKQGAELTDNEAAVVIMDWIDGEDMQTLLYKKVLEKTHGKDFAENSNMSIGHLHDAVARELNFPIPDETKPDGLWADFSERNKIVMNFLGRKGESVPQTYVDQLRNTVELMNSKGYYHNDLHWRNVMIEYDTKGKPSEADKLFVIDFDTLSKANSGFDDKVPANLLAELNKRNIGIDPEREQASFIEEIIPLQQKVSRYKPYKELSEAVNNEAFAKSLEYLVQMAPDVQDMELLCASVWDLQEKNPDLIPEVTAVVESMMPKMESKPEKMRKILKLFVK